MSILVEKQHYVWRRYLKPWSVGGEGKQICTYFTNKDEMFITSLMNVAQERFFYEICPLSNIELIAARGLINKFPAFLKSYAEDLLLAYEVVSKERLSDADRLEFSKNFFEKRFSKIELYGTNLLNCESLNDFISIPNLDQTVYYLCAQYGRTKKIRQSGVQKFLERPFAGQLLDKLFPMIAILHAATLAHNLVVIFPTKYIFVKNISSIPFLTSDQPAINLFGDDLDENGDVKSFELYYPTSPSTAIIISLRPELEKYSEIQANEHMVQELNSKICQNALLYIFSNDRNNIDCYKRGKK